MSDLVKSVSGTIGPVGVIGLGNMGLAMAVNLVGSGFEVVGTDLIAESRNALNKAGGTAVADTREVGKRCRHIILSLPSEAALHAVRGVHDCAVFGIPDDEFGEALMAVVEPQAGVTLDVADIRAQLKTVLADYKVPKHVEILKALPREDSGKIFKRRLRDPYWERAGRRI